MDAVVEHLHHVRAAQRGCGLGFAFEALGTFGGGGDRRVHQLDRDPRIERQVLGQPNGAHAALAELTVEPITSRENSLHDQKPILIVERNRGRETMFGKLGPAASI